MPIIESGKTVGAYIYDTLLSNPNGKIRGKLVRTIERKYYKDELYRILRKQQTFHAELQNRDLYEACIEELYPYNDAHRNLIASRDFTYLFVEDILFYQRPLKSKKSLIADCPYEGHTYIDKKTGEHPYIPLKCIAKSHPLFQEFRLWQFVSYLRIYQKEGVVNGKLTSDIDVTHEFLKSEEDYVTLFDWLNDKKEIKQDLFFRCPLFKLKKNELSNYRWNYAEDKIYPCNETRTTLLLRLEKADILKSSLTREREDALWHLLYSISDKGELVKALHSFAAKQGWAEDSFVDTFRNIPPFEKDYGAYSSKAIKKLLPLMRMGKYWKWENIDIQTQDRINKILTGEYDENIKVRIRDKVIHLTEPASFRGLPVWLACYIVYNRFSEAKELVEWKSPSDIDVFLQHFKQHSLRNPIVEQVILETLRTVRDIWKLVGHIDEIHVELGREMKNPVDCMAADPGNGAPVGFALFIKIRTRSQFIGFLCADQFHFADGSCVHHVCRLIERRVITEPHHGDDPHGRVLVRFHDPVQILKSQRNRFFAENMDLPPERFHAHFRMSVERSVDADNIGLDLVQHCPPVLMKLRAEAGFFRHGKKTGRIVAASRRDRGERQFRHIRNAFKNITAVSAASDHA